MKHSPDYQSLARLAVIQHLRSYGIKIKHWNCKQRPEAARGQPSGKVFGTALHSLPQVYVPDYGAIPSFLVDICKYLELHAHTEGLFRKSGSIMRQKLLKTKLDSGENGLSDAPPCDVAGILKQFFRELPEPILPIDLQDALCKAQHLTSNEEKASATLLISCLVPERSVNILRYIFSFLHTVSMRSDVNKMDSNNLAVVFAPNLLQSNDDHEKMSASTEKKLRAQAEVVRTLIDHSADIGSVPQFLLEKIPGMLGVDGGTPGPEASEDGEVDPVAEKKRRRRSVGDYVSGALNKLITNRTPSSTPQSERNVLGSMVTPLILTPSTKRKLPVDSVQGFSTKKRKSIKNSLAFDLLPNSLFGSGSTPASAGFESPHTSLDSSQSSLSPFVSSGRYLSSSSVLRRSKRCENRKVQRMDSGKTGCFSPKISRKEMVRRSLRLRFSLGKSSKDVKSQNIGWRLANSQELTPVATSSKVEALSFPVESPFVSAGSKHISKSEENLLSPPLPESDHRKSWTGPQAFKLEDTRDEGTPVAGHLWAAHGFSEPVLCGKPPAMPKVQRSLTNSYNQDQNKNESLCQEEMNLADNTVTRITRAFTEFGSDLQTVMAGASCAVDKVSDLEDVVVSHKHLEDEESASALVVASVSGEDAVLQEKGEDEIEESVVMSPAKCRENDLIEEPVESVTEEHFFVTDTRFRDSEPCQKLFIEEIVLDAPHEASETLPCSDAQVDSTELPEDMSVPCQEMESFHSDAATSSLAQECCPTPRRSSRVSDHIQHFNKLCLSDRTPAQKPKSPIKLQRTPVRQSVRRINSLSEMAKPTNGSGKRQSTTSLPIMKSVSFDGSRSSDLSCVHPGNTLLSQYPEASVSSEQVTTVDVRSRQSREQPIKHRGHIVPNPTNPIKSVLEDVTNQEIPKNASKRPALSGRVAKNCAVLITSGREHHRYKGSPKNPIGRVTFLPCSKPLEL